MPNWSRILGLSHGSRQRGLESHAFREQSCPLFQYSFYDSNFITNLQLVPPKSLQESLGQHTHTSGGWRCALDYDMPYGVN